MEELSVGVRGELEPDRSRPIEADRDLPANATRAAALTADFVFYPFGGPDVLCVAKFFPDAPVYVALRIGTRERYPDARGAESEPRSSVEELALGSLYALFHRSYFSTSEMNRQFHGQLASGVLPVMDLLLARTGNTIEAMQFGTIADSGRFAVEPHTQGASHAAVEITWQVSSDRAPQKLDYVQTDLATGFTARPGFSRFVMSLGTPETLVKSASFLLFGKDFVALCDQILATRDLILEDDSASPGDGSRTRRGACSYTAVGPTRSPVSE